MKTLPFILFLLSLTITIEAQTIKPMEKNGLYGLKDGKNIIVDYQYDTIKTEFNGGFYVRKDGKWGKLSSKGKEIIPCKYDDLDSYWPHLNLAVYNGLKGVLDSTGGIVLDLIYDDIDHLDGNVALVKYQGKWCYYHDGIYNYNEEEFIFHFADTMPLFSGCDKSLGTYQEFKDCSVNQLYAFIFKNLTYPVQARRRSIQGQVILQFTVTKEGDVRDIKVVHAIGGGCDEETVRMMKTMPNWIPAVKEGKKVNCQFTLPIKFVLQKK